MSGPSYTCSHARTHAICLYAGAQVRCIDGLFQPVPPPHLLTVAVLWFHVPSNKELSAVQLVPSYSSGLAGQPVRVCVTVCV